MAALQTALTLDDSIAVSSLQTHSLRIDVTESKFVLGATLPRPCTPQALAQHVPANHRACYFVLAGAGSLLRLVLFVPDAAPAKEKMLIASSAAVLKRLLGGAARFAGDVSVHDAADLAAELDAAAPLRAASSDDANLSVRERAIKQLNEAERSARAEAGTSTQALISPRSGSTSKAGGGIGGFHVNTIPLTEAASAALSQLSTRSGLVVLRVSDDGKSIDADGDVSDCAVDALADRMRKTEEPRFYAFRGETGSSIVFVMLVPNDSPRKLRMVYSTAKQSVSDALAAVPGVRVQGKLEWDSDDLVELAKAPGQFLKSCTAPAPRASSGAPVRTNAAAASSAGNMAAHPVYGQMGPTSRSGKKIVLPPRGAW
jgi:hypothetical protein